MWLAGGAIQGGHIRGQQSDLKPNTLQGRLPRSAFFSKLTDFTSFHCGKQPLPLILHGVKHSGRKLIFSF
jgi:hypothetical protein